MSRPILTKRPGESSPAKPLSFSPQNEGKFKHKVSTGSPTASIDNLSISRGVVGHSFSGLSTSSTFFSPLLTSIHSVVKNRTGAVFSRNTILKSDQYDIDDNANEEFNLQGAPNFRMADQNIFGVAQPTISGISSVLTLLKCHPTSTNNKEPTYWFSAREEPMIYINRRPFVLRDGDNPLKNIRRYQGINSARLEQMENRLKEDILKEVTKCNGLLLVHDEIDNNVVPFWTAVDSVMTNLEVFQDLKKQGYKVEYVRIPISPEQAPDDRYLDEFVHIIKKCSLQQALVFNCGMGVSRTTFAMVTAMLIREFQSLGVFEKNAESSPLKASLASLTLLEENENRSRSLLRLVYILEKALYAQGYPDSAISWALQRTPLIEDMRNAVQGNYQFILQLLTLLKDGTHCKKLLDDAINKCDRMLNLREIIFKQRVQYSITGEGAYLEKAHGYLERYFFLLVFCSYLDENYVDNYEVTFENWIKARPEICRMMDYFRKKGPRLQFFRPIDDLSAFSGTLGGPAAAHGGRVVSELERSVVKSRTGTVLVPNTILKLDLWSKKLLTKGLIEGAGNFRAIPGMTVFGVAQPTRKGMSNVIKHILKMDSSINEILWINLREEPLIYINSLPYVLRDQYLTLRNIKSFSGITPARLEFLEERLKDDVIAETRNLEGRVLTHDETSEGNIVPSWQDASPENIMTIKEIMEDMKMCDNDHGLQYVRVPITAETPPDESDFDLFIQILSSMSLEGTAVVLNCQMGLGRSTTGSVITCLIQLWLKSKDIFRGVSTSAESKLSYQVIHSLLRVIKNGLECKRVVDHVIDQCAEKVNLRDDIEYWRSEAENATDDELRRKSSVSKGLLHLKRYFMLIVFQCYLNDTPPDTMDNLETFKTWLSRHQEIQLMRSELEESSIEALTPVEKMRPGDGIALTSEVLDVVSNRCGSVLGPQTILKYDMFPGCQKMSLPDKIDGAPNFRKISTTEIRCFGQYSAPYQSESFVYGSAMPTERGVRKVLEKIKAGSQGIRRILWTSLREEPVIYVNGRPYVLRLFRDPLKNLEATGIAKERVEQMEAQMKKDVLAELFKFNGRLLLHEEKIDGAQFCIVPVWESVTPGNVRTPLEVYEMIVSEGYRVDYLRLPITDEQAPIPDVFDQLTTRLARVVTEDSVDAIFNCQMGRGRTTTGMIITCLMEIIIGNQDGFHQLNLDESEKGDSDSTEENDAHRFKAGEYKIILQLISVLQHGKLSKKLTDFAIDKCDSLQNLRIAIYDYKLRIEALDEDSSKRHALLEVGLNYLVRYFYLIVFADFLMETMGPDTKGQVNGLLFSKWLLERQEIVNIVRPSNQTLE